MNAAQLRHFLANHPEMAGEIALLKGDTGDQGASAAATAAPPQVAAADVVATAAREGTLAAAPAAHYAPSDEVESSSATQEPKEQDDLVSMMQNLASPTKVSDTSSRVVAQPGQTAAATSNEDELVVGMPTRWIQNRSAQFCSDKDGSSHWKL